MYICSTYVFPSEHILLSVMKGDPFVIDSYQLLVVRDKVWESGCVVLLIIHLSLCCAIKNLSILSNRFISAMKKFTLLSMPSATAPSYTVPPSSTSEVHAPPTAIMDYPALAHFTNSLVASFNDLRLCIPTSLAISVTQEVTQAVRALADSIVEFYK